MRLEDPSCDYNYTYNENKIFSQWIPVVGNNMFWDQTNIPTKPCNFQI